MNKRDEELERVASADTREFNQAIADTLAFEKGAKGGDNNPNSPFPHQPTPVGMSDYVNNSSGTPSSSSDVPSSTGGGLPIRPQSTITEDTLRKGDEILRKYKQGKHNLEEKIVRNEKWWKMKHWDLIALEANADDPKPASGWLFNTIISKHADYMDAFPTCDILPREPDDVEEAKRLSSIIPVVMAQNDYKQVYSEEVWYKLKHGTGVYGIFWDKSKLNGLGDISIKCIDALSVFWEPGVKNIQDSKNLFTVELVDNDVIENTFPQVKGKLSGTSDTILKKYWHDDSIDTTNKSAVIDWYYHKDVNGKKTLQYIKYVADQVLFATEDDPEMAQRGLYDHGKYPFVFDVLFPDTDMPCGFGFVDICKNAQTTIDIYNNAFEKNVQFMASPRYICRNDGGINEEEFANPSALLVHTDGNLGEDSIAPINVPALINGNYVNLLDAKINEMKETAGNRDATTGGTQAGVTAASAIAAMQESAGKTSRDQISNTYEAHKDVVELVIELIRQFYDMPRQFRIVGEKGQQEFAVYSNENLQPVYQGTEFGVDMGYRIPLFDVEVKTEKENAYSQVSQNELALQFYNLGFFNPEYADQALACMDMMDFKGKQMVVEKVEQNGGMYQQMLQMQQQLLQLSEMVDQLTGGQLGMADQTANAINATMGEEQPRGGSSEIYTGNGGEASIVSKARQNAQSVTQPR